MKRLMMVFLVILASLPAFAKARKVPMPVLEAGVKSAIVLVMDGIEYPLSKIEGEQLDRDRFVAETNAANLNFELPSEPSLKDLRVDCDDYACSLEIEIESEFDPHGGVLLHVNEEQVGDAMRPQDKGVVSMNPKLPGVAKRIFPRYKLKDEIGLWLAGDYRIEYRLPVFVPGFEGRIYYAIRANFGLHPRISEFSICPPHAAFSLVRYGTPAADTLTLETSEGLLIATASRTNLDGAYATYAFPWDAAVEEKLRGVMAANEKEHGRAFAVLFIRGDGDEVVTGHYLAPEDLKPNCVPTTPGPGQ